MSGAASSVTAAVTCRFDGGRCSASGVDAGDRLGNVYFGLCAAIAGISARRAAGDELRASIRRRSGLGEQSAFRYE